MLSFFSRVSQADIICQFALFLQVEGMQVHANEGGSTQTRGGIYWIILPAGCKSVVSPTLLYHMISQTTMPPKNNAIVDSLLHNLLMLCARKIYSVGPKLLILMKHLGVK
jgi:hypothetical protein